jgi:Mg-chelatase subunit ChlI
MRIAVEQPEPIDGPEAVPKDDLRDAISLRLRHRVRRREWLAVDVFLHEDP